MPSDTAVKRHYRPGTRHWSKRFEKKDLVLTDPNLLACYFAQI